MQQRQQQGQLQAHFQQAWLTHELPQEPSRKQGFQEEPPVQAHRSSVGSRRLWPEWRPQISWSTWRDHQHGRTDGDRALQLFSPLSFLPSVERSIFIQVYRIRRVTHLLFFDLLNSSGCISGRCSCLADTTISCVPKKKLKCTTYVSLMGDAASSLGASTGVSALEDSSVAGACGIDK